MSVQDLALQRDKYRHLTNEEWRWLLQQVEGRERTADKLPCFAAIDDWWYPVRLSLEQCSSEQTARYKASLVERPLRSKSKVERSAADLTAGYGVDTWFLSEHFTHTDYVEQNEELCRIAKHNFKIKNSKLKIQNSSLEVHHSTAEEFLETAGQYDLIYLDPARRDAHGGKVFRLEDCTPNVVTLLPTLLRHLTPDGQILLKLSPMLDITQALNTLTISPSPLTFDVHVIAVKNEVKEVLLLSGGNGSITAIDLAEPDKAFRFTREEEQLSTINSPTSLNSRLSIRRQQIGRTLNYLYEPNAAILKAGAYKLLGSRFGLQKLDTNTHLYASDHLIADFPGRVWRIERTLKDRKDLPQDLHQANVLTRNYPLRPEELKKKLHLRDGGTAFIIGARVAGRPTLYLGYPA